MVNRDPTRQAPDERCQQRGNLVGAKVEPKDAFESRNRTLIDCFVLFGTVTRFENRNTGALVIGQFITNTSVTSDRTRPMATSTARERMTPASRTFS